MTCSHDVKVTLFRCFCANMYTSNIWCSFKKNTYNKLSVSYNNMVRIMLGLPKIGSVRQHCVQSRIPSFGELIRMYVYSIMTRVKKSENILLKALECSDIRYKSPLRKYWRTIMYKQCHYSFIHLSYLPYQFYILYCTVHLLCLFLMVWY